MSSAAHPRPATPLEEAGDYYENYWTKEKLSALTEQEDLETVKRIEIKVDSTKTGVDDLGRHLIKLEQLKLNNSYLPIVRDLGTGFKNLVYLWMARCHVRELDGISSFTNLKEVYLAYNQISDISDLSRLENIEIVDLERNEISEVDQIEYLCLCPRLNNLTLEGNPFLDKLKNDDSRKKILDLLPNLEVLDDISIVKNETLANLERERPVTSHGYEYNKQHSPDQIRRPQRPASASVMGRTAKFDTHHLTPIPNVPKIKELDFPSHEERSTIYSRGRIRRNTLQTQTSSTLPVLEPITKSFLPPIAGAIKPSTYESVPPSSEPPLSQSQQQPILHPRRRQIVPRNNELNEQSSTPLVVLAARRKRSLVGAPSNTNASGSPLLIPKPAKLNCQS